MELVVSLLSHTLISAAEQSVVSQSVSEQSMSDSLAHSGFTQGKTANVLQRSAVPAAAFRKRNRYQ